MVWFEPLLEEYEGVPFVETEEHEEETEEPEVDDESVVSPGDDNAPSLVKEKGR